MSRPAPPMPAKLVIGLFTRHVHLTKPLIEQVNERFGPIDLISPWFEFNQTRYYEPEMGAGLRRRMIALSPLIQQDQLPAVKLQTNALESRYTADGNRQVNIDPGYLLSERFVLATGKNFTHRIYIGSQIYADLTLIYQKGDFQALPWTYPDYAGQDIKAFLKRVRNKYHKDLKTDGHL